MLLGMEEMMGQRIERLRKARRIGQKELGRACGYSESWVSNLESGKIADLKVTAALAMARYLGVDLNYLVYGEGVYQSDGDGTPPVAVPWVDLVAILEIDPEIGTELLDIRETESVETYKEAIATVAESWRSNARMALRMWRAAQHARRDRPQSGRHGRVGERE
jgi:transcriptional regulator with XRE-family HTH domain